MRNWSVFCGSIGLVVTILVSSTPPALADDQEEFTGRKSSLQANYEDQLVSKLYDKCDQERIEDLSSCYAEVDKVYYFAADSGTGVDDGRGGRN